MFFNLSQNLFYQDSNLFKNALLDLKIYLNHIFAMNLQTFE